jgi:hypothetical protein
MEKKFKNAITLELQSLVLDEEFSVKRFRKLRKVLRLFKKKPRKFLKKLLKKSLKEKAEKVKAEKAKAEDDSAATAEHQEGAAEARADADQQASTTAEAG